MDQLEKTLHSIEAPLVLDVATGSGNFARLLRTDYQGIGTIIGIDISQKGLVRFREAMDEIGDMISACMDSSRIALADESIDMICISNSLHHMADLEDTLMEMKRVLKPGGYFLLSEMFRDNQTESQMTHVMLHQWWASIDTLNGIPHFNTFRKEKILHLCDLLQLDELITGEYSSLDSDPMDEKTIDSLNGAIDTYISRSDNIENNSELVKRGMELRERLNRIGFHGATTLTAFGRKPQ